MMKKILDHRMMVGRMRGRTKRGWIEDVEVVARNKGVIQGKEDLQEIL